MKENRKEQEKEDNDFTFPFSTCEKPNKKGIAQPYSTVINMLSIFVILFFLFQAKNIYVFCVILSLFAFEFVHTFSHMIHLPNYIQMNIVHSLAYVINFFYLLTLYNYTHKAPSPFFLTLLATLVLIDIYSFMFLSFVFYFTSSILIFFSIIIYYYKYIPKKSKNYIPIILLLGASIMLLFYNEIFNCKKILEMFPNFPLHAFIELNGTFNFYFICKFFTTLS